MRVRSDRELIEYVRDRLIEQGRMSGTGGLSCQYTDDKDSNVHCAAGWLMDLSVLLSRFNSCGIFSAASEPGCPMDALLAGGVLKEQTELVGKLQSMHDSGPRPNEGKDEWVSYIIRNTKLILDNLNDKPLAA